MKKLALAAMLATLGVTSAVAADLPARTMYTKAAPIVAPAVNWSGFYIGGQVGGAGSSGGYVQTDTGLPSEDIRVNPSSVIGGAHAGVQGQWGSWVLGLEGTFNFSGLKETVPSPVFPDRTRTLQTGDIATVVGKLGYASGQWLFYAKGGFADAHIKTATFNPAGGLNVVSETTLWTAGYTVGGGVDYKLTQNWILGADFNYYNFRFTPGFAVSNVGSTATGTNGRDQIYAGTVRLSYLFNLAGTGRGY
jgi:outer membrane immunogenic protein